MRNVVVITIKGGSVESVTADTPEDVGIIVRDYDVEGLFEEDLEEDNEGHLFREYEMDCDM